MTPNYLLPPVSNERFISVVETWSSTPNISSNYIIILNVPSRGVCIPKSFSLMMVGVLFSGFYERAFILQKSFYSLLYLH